MRLSLLSASVDVCNATDRLYITFHLRLPRVLSGRNLSELWSQRCSELDVAVRGTVLSSSTSGGNEGHGTPCKFLTCPSNCSLIDPIPSKARPHIELLVPKMFHQMEALHCIFPPSFVHHMRRRRFLFFRTQEGKRTHRQSAMFPEFIHVL